MTMVTTHPETERPQSPESSADREPNAPPRPSRTRRTPRRSGHPDAPRAASGESARGAPLRACCGSWPPCSCSLPSRSRRPSGRSVWQQQRDADNRAAALAAGRQIAVNFVTMNAASFDADTKRVLDESTGAFQKEYASTLAQLKPVVTANKTVSTVERAEASLVSSDDDSAKVIVGIVAPTSNASTPRPRRRRTGSGSTS